MRSEKEMFDLILGFARRDERVRAVILDGSRADPEAPRDIWQDYDIVYIVSDVQSFKQDAHWIDFFGERMILQLPDDMGESARHPRASWCYLMQFMDGTRIDLTIYPADKLDEVKVDSYCYPLLDKDNLLPEGPFRNEAAYYPSPPSAKEFADCCNEFWWCCPYVAKGLWRGEIIYAKHMMDDAVREQLMKMLVWHVGILTGYKKNPGKYGKRFQKYLEPGLWDLLLRTYSTADIESTWDALVHTCELFRLVAPKVATYFGFDYPRQEDERVSDFLREIRSSLKPESADISTNQSSR